MGTEFQEQSGGELAKKKDSEGDHVNPIFPSFLPLKPGALIKTG